MANDIWRLVHVPGAAELHYHRRYRLRNPRLEKLAIGDHTTVDIVSRIVVVRLNRDINVFSCRIIHT